MTAQMDEVPLLDAGIRFDNLPATGRMLKVKSTPPQNIAVAERLSVESVERLSAELNVKPIKGGVEVKGFVKAVVTQSCVVTFVPVSQEIEETISRIFLNGNIEDGAGRGGSEVFIDLEGDDLPDYFDGAEVDFTEILLEHVALAIDQFPRAEGAQLPTQSEDDAPENLSPFAGLKHLKSTRD